MKKELIISIAITIIVIIWMIFMGVKTTVSRSMTPLPSSGTITQSSQTNSFTATTVSTHNTANDCWLIINKKVYDATSFISQHPGGDTAIISYCGADATAAFDAIKGGRGHSSNATAILESLFIGTLQ